MGISAKNYREHHVATHREVGANWQLNCLFQRGVQGVKLPFLGG